MQLHRAGSSWRLPASSGGAAPICGCLRTDTPKLLFSWENYDKKSGLGYPIFTQTTVSTVSKLESHIWLACDGSWAPLVSLLFNRILNIPKTETQKYPRARTRLADRHLRRDPDHLPGIVIDQATHLRLVDSKSHIWMFMIHNYKILYIYIYGFVWK